MEKQEKFILLEGELKTIIELKESIKLLFSLYEKKWYSRKERSKILESINETIMQIRSELYEKDALRKLLVTFYGGDQSRTYSKLIDTLETIEIGTEIIEKRVADNNKEVLETTNPENRTLLAYEFKKVNAQNELYVLRDLFETRKDLQTNSKYPYEKRLEMYKTVEYRINSLLLNSQVIKIKKELCWKDEEQIKRLYDEMEKIYVTIITSPSKLQKYPKIPFNVFSNEYDEQVLKTLEEAGKKLLLEIYTNESPDNIVTKYQFASKKEDLIKLMRKIGEQNNNKYQIEYGILLANAIMILSIIAPELGIPFPNINIDEISTYGMSASALGMVMGALAFVLNDEKIKKDKEKKKEDLDTYQKCKQEIRAQLAFTKEMLKQYNEQYNIPNTVALSSVEHTRLRK